MGCKDCIYWESIGDADTVMKYKQEHQEIPETVFDKFIPSDKDTHFYGRCTKYDAEAIKASEASCGQFTTKRTTNGV